MRSLQRKANKAHEVHEELMRLRVSALFHFYRMGELVKEVRDEGYWEVLGHDSFEAYLSDPDVSIPVSSAYHAIGVVETFPDFEEIEDLTVRNTISILSAVRHENADRKELVNMAGNLSTSDLRHEMSNLNLIESKPKKDLPKVYRCKDCSKIKGVYWQDLCHCGMTPEAVDKVSKIIQNE